MGKIISVLVRIRSVFASTVHRIYSRTYELFPDIYSAIANRPFASYMLEDFDFLIGQWRVFNTRLANWLCECSEWINFESFHTEQKSNTGPGNFAVHEYKFGNALCERSILRQFDDRSQFWKIDRMDTMSALAMPSLKGTFWNNKGSFLSKGIFNGQDVLVWVEWTKICKNYAYWEQAFSKDEGKSWELNWVMEFYREK